MKLYTVVVSQSAEKELQRLPARIIGKIIVILKSLEENPRPSGCKKLKGYKNLWVSGWVITGLFIVSMMLFCWWM